MAKEVSKRLIEVEPEQIQQLVSLRGVEPEESTTPIARSVQEVGMIHPPVVDSRMNLVSGGRRLCAAKRLSRKSIQVIQEDHELTEAQIIQRQLIENRHRQNLKPTEEAKAVQRYIELNGILQNVAAGKLGMSCTAVANLLAIPSLPEWIRDKIDAREIPASAAPRLLCVTNVEEQAALAKRLCEGTLTRDGLVGALKNRSGGSQIRPARKLARGVAVLGDGRSVTVRGAELTLETFIETIETVLAKARRVRTRGIDLPKFLKTLRTESKAATTTS